MVGGSTSTSFTRWRGIARRIIDRFCCERDSITHHPPGRAESAWALTNSLPVGEYEISMTAPEWSLCTYTYRDGNTHARSTVVA